MSASKHAENDAKPLPTDKPYVFALAEALDALSAQADAGKFAGGGPLLLAPPMSINIHEVGAVSFPIQEQQAALVKQQCELAPFGRKEHTVVDTRVRNTWQLNPSQFTIETAGWDSYLQQQVASNVRMALDLPPNAPLKLSLYKLLMYEKGGFFVPHRDTEKEPGMFATLMILLPSDHTGGELLVQQNWREERFDFKAPESLHQMHFACFYADCKHEVRPVVSGHRVCLIYNICHDVSGPGTSSLPRQPIATSKLVEALRAWASDADRRVEKLLFVLDHSYTAAELSLSSVKGADRVQVDVLRQACAAAGIDAYLAQIEKRESGPVDDDYNDYDEREEFEDEEEDEDGSEDNERQNQHRPDLASFEPEECEFTAANFISILTPTNIESFSAPVSGSSSADSASGSSACSNLSDAAVSAAASRASVHSSSIGSGSTSMESIAETNMLCALSNRLKQLKLPVDGALICPDGALEDYEENVEATGNEGTTVERWYTAVAVVLWPQSLTMIHMADKLPEIFCLTVQTIFDEWKQKGFPSLLRLRFDPAVIDTADVKPMDAVSLVFELVDVVCYTC